MYICLKAILGEIYTTKWAQNMTNGPKMLHQNDNKNTYQFNGHEIHRSWHFRYENESSGNLAWKCIIWQPYFWEISALQLLKNKRGLWMEQNNGNILISYPRDVKRRNLKIVYIVNICWRKNANAIKANV
jgi:hypothetical protein